LILNDSIIGSIISEHLQIFCANASQSISFKNDLISFILLEKFSLVCELNAGFKNSLKLIT
jgi:hypothetical protein